jgi:hypothetical protein
MLRAKTSNGVFILGLDAENIKRLKEGKPILVSLAELGGKDDVMIMYGDTIDDMVKELESETGAKLPPAQDINKIRNTQ